MRRGRYYLGRVIKLGSLDQDKLFNAIISAPTLLVGKYRWTITDVHKSKSDEFPYIYGRLSKFSKEGHVTLVDTRKKSQFDTVAENLLVASAPFVYLPKYSGIAYLHVWNGIHNGTFTRRFKSIIEAKYDNFFVDCSIEPVSDYRAFTAKLKEIDLFVEISAKVYPPNPLFGRLWGSLKDYVSKRNAAELTVKEVSDEGKGLTTNLGNLMVGIMKDSNFIPDVETDITDAALLMAADGYGQGKVIGEKDGSLIVIKTSETQKSFLNDKEPEPISLAKETQKHFNNISKERDMGH